MGLSGLAGTAGVPPLTPPGPGKAGVVVRPWRTRSSTSDIVIDPLQGSPAGRGFVRLLFCPFVFPIFNVLQAEANNSADVDVWRCLTGHDPAAHGDGSHLDPVGQALDGKQLLCGMAASVFGIVCHCHTRSFGWSRHSLSAPAGFHRFVCLEINALMASFCIQRPC